MGHFPVPREELPAIHVSPEEHYYRKDQLQGMLESLVDDYDKYTRSSRQVDTRKWKPSSTRDHLKLYKEKPGWTDHTTSSSSGEYNSSTTSDPNSESRIAHASFDTTTSSNMTFSEETADNLRMTLMVGEYAGRMENAMYATIATTQEELALVDIFLHEDVADCAVLNMMEGPTAEDPFHFLGYKWFVRKSPGPSRIVSHRDTVYVECSGLTKTKSGDTIGYHLMHSVDLMDFPAMPERNCIRFSQSIRALYRQRPGNVVEVFSVGNLDLAGVVRGPLAAVFIQEALFNMPKLIDCGESKRLTKMFMQLRFVREQRMHEIRQEESCSLCRQPKKRFSGGSITACDVCGVDTCGKCRMTRRVYQSDGILGKFRKIKCCKSCVLAAKSASHGGGGGAVSSSSVSSSVSETREENNSISGDSSSPSTKKKTISIRSLAEQIEIRHRTTSNGGADTMSPPPPPEPQAATLMQIRIPAGNATASGWAGEQPTRSTMSIGSMDRGRLDSNMSVESGASSYGSYSVAVASPSIVVGPRKQPTMTPRVTSTAQAPPVSQAPSATSHGTTQPQDMYKRLLELQQKAKDTYAATKHNQMYMAGNRIN